MILLVDCRHKPTSDDVLMYDFIKHYDYIGMVVATKSDKISRNEKAKSEKVIRQTLNMPQDERLIYFSSLSKDGRQEILSEIEKMISNT